MLFLPFLFLITPFLPIQYAALVAYRCCLSISIPEIPPRAGWAYFFLHFRFYNVVDLA